MLPRKNRVSTSQFKTMLEKGRLYHSGFFSLRVSKEAQAEPRFSVVVAKKVAPKAVARNLWRRKVRNIVYPLLKEVKPGSSGIFFLRKEALSLSHADLRREAVDLMLKADIMAK